MKVKAKIDAGVLNRRTKKLVKPLCAPDDPEIFPTFGNGESIHGGFLVIAGREYEISDEYSAEPDTGLWTIFEPVGTAPKSKKRAE